MLEKNSFNYVEFKPLLFHKFILTQTLRRTKTDKNDDHTIVKYLMATDHKHYVNSFFYMNKLKLCISYI